MFSLGFFIRNVNNNFSTEVAKYLKIASGIDKFKYEIQASEYYNKIVNESIHNFEKNNFNIEDSYGESSYCFYCGQKAEVIIPAYMHNGSGVNLWMYKDWRFTTLLCSSCDKHAGKRKVSYNKKFSEISPNNPKQILKLEPDILLPSLEPAFKHFKYLKNGTLEPLTIRGEATIKCFSLNRQDLVERRMHYMIQYEREKEFNQNMTSLDVLFCIAQEKDFDLDNDEYMEYLAKFLHRKSNLYVDKDEIHNLLKIEFPTTTYKKISENRIRTRYYYPDFSGLKNIRLTGIRGFEENQILNFDGRKSLILIGENGVGKSTLLELIKRIIKPKTKLTLTDLINIGNDDARIEVEYNDFSVEKLNFSEIQGYINGKKQLCNLIEVSELRILDSQMTKLINWISLIHNEESNNEFNSLFDWIERQLKILISLSTEAILKVEDGHVFWLRNNNTSQREYLENFSSGYKSIMIIFYSIVSKFINSYSVNAFNILKQALSNTVVSIDEIELHLHPVFKKTIIEKLKKVFPEVLFIITTHDPLVLKSAGGDTKVILLKKTDNKTIIKEELPDHKYMSTGQILTSPIFGLSTIESSKEIQDNLDAYYKALEQKNWVKVDKYREKLADSGLFGNTYRELIAMSAVDAYLVKKEIPSVDVIAKILENLDA